MVQKIDPNRLDLDLPDFWTDSLQSLVCGMLPKEDEVFRLGRCSRREVNWFRGYFFDWKTGSAWSPISDSGWLRKHVLTLRGQAHVSVYHTYITYIYIYYIELYWHIPLQKCITEKTWQWENYFKLWQLFLAVRQAAKVYLWRISTMDLHNVSSWHFPSKYQCWLWATHALSIYLYLKPPWWTLNPCREHGFLIEHTISIVPRLL
jgi:hypothetical protein